VSAAAAGPVRLRRDMAYLRGHYLQWLAFRSRQRWPLLAALLLAGAGLACLLWQPAARPLLAAPVAVLVLLAAVLAGMPVVEFRRWRRRALAGQAAMPDLVLELRDGVLVFGAGDEEGVRLQARGDVVRVWRGRFVYVAGRDGRHLYLTDRWAGREDVAPLLAAWADAGASR
jgi:hypothetical protein